ncbi:hypothetical protein [Planobispora rosea]|uniref:hypothetical protein n=1 Tax=Planobispora rosea TaxID=35762 RepID=UPI00083B2474|nr:hypothetical protein [Planobispora rosea]
MATVTGGDIARLIPTAPPGITATHLHSAAREVWPSVDLRSVTLLLHSLVDDGHAARTGGDTEPARYHLKDHS